MMEQAFTASAKFEHSFWLQILGDHARFIYRSLGPKEQTEIGKAQYFIGVFDQLLMHARQAVHDADIARLNSAVFPQVQQLRDFKLHLLRRHLTGQINVSLSPSFLNHMVNELEEYMRILSCLLAGRLPPKGNPLHYHLVWLNDAFGHAASIASQLDLAEKKLIRKGQEYEKHFNDLYLKAVELSGYLRANLDRFPALTRFNKEAELEMLMFMEFLTELEEADIEEELLGTLSPLIFDHMSREECYYLLQLSMVSETEAPGCDPAKPRVEA